MKNRISAVVAVIAVIACAFAAVATAASPKTTNGTVSSFTYVKSTKVGHLVVKTKSSKVKFKVTSATNCGVSRGQSGDQIQCKTLGAARYHGKSVTVQWHKSGTTRVASLVAVHLH